MANVESVAVIPARGGSKRIPRKNIRPFLGVPMLARTVDIVRRSEVVERIFVSTDDDEVADVAVRAGAEVAFRRPAELADDHTPTVPVIAHAIQALMAVGVDPRYVCCVYPAAVLSRVEDYRLGIAALRERDLDYAFTATSFAFPIQRALRRRPTGGCEMFWPEHALSRSQDLEPAFHDAGQFYWGTRSAWLDGKPLFGPRSHMIVMPRHHVQDIDTIEDWERAELLYQLVTRHV